MNDFGDRYRLYWGDLHNHNAVGYAKGSLARSIDIAREHLDFFAFTGHASWHDMPEMPGERHMHWVNGFRAHRDHWPATRRMIREASDDGFQALLGYEWHSSRFGDYCVILPGDLEEPFLPDHVDPLLDFVERQGALAVPHHVAYKEGWRGANWSHHRAGATPVVEIFSEQGCTLSDRSPFPMILHSNGGRVTSNTVEWQLERGLRFGFVASTDDHFGYPGAYGEGVAGVWAEELSPRGIFEALRARRTVAATGDRIQLAFRVNGRPMGSELRFVRRRVFDVAVQAPDSIEVVELLRGGRVIRRRFPQDRPPGGPGLPGPALCRIQYGWGPWSALALDRICRWEMDVRITGGRFLGFERCFQTGPFDEDLRDRARQESAGHLSLRSHTSRRDAFLLDPTKALICRMEAGVDARLEISLSKPVAWRIVVPVEELARGSRIEFVGEFTSESLCVHRLVFPWESAARVRWQEDRDAHPDRAR